MGILNGTRINFWGGIQSNVCVANNTNKPGGEEILDLVNATISGDKTDEEMIAWMRAPGSIPAEQAGEGFAGRGVGGAVCD